MKSKTFVLVSYFQSLFLVGQKLNKTVLIKGTRKENKLYFYVVSKIALTHWVISDPCENKNML